MITTQFLTINQTAKEIGLPATCLRSMLATGNLPGFYSGTRFYVNLDMFRAKLEQDSRSAMSNSKEAAQ